MHARRGRAERVEKRELDQVQRAVRPSLQVPATLSQYQRDVLSLVQPAGVLPQLLPQQRMNARIHLDGGHVAGTVVESAQHLQAAARSDDKHLGPVGQAVRECSGHVVEEGERLQGAVEAAHRGYGAAVEVQTDLLGQLAQLSHRVSRELAGRLADRRRSDRRQLRQRALRSSHHAGVGQPERVSEPLVLRAPDLLAARGEARGKHQCAGDEQPQLPAPAKPSGGQRESQSRGGGQNQRNDPRPDPEEQRDNRRSAEPRAEHIEEVEPADTSRLDQETERDAPRDEEEGNRQDQIKDQQVPELGRLRGQPERLERHHLAEGETDRQAGGQRQRACCEEGSLFPRDSTAQ